MLRTIGLAAVLTVVAASGSLAEPKLVRVAAFVPERSVIVTHMMKPFVEAVNAEAGDEVTFKGYWGGALGRNPRKQYDLILKGIADSAFIAPGYSPGKFPDYGLFELPFLARTGLEASIAMWRMFRQGHVSGFGKVKLLGTYGTDVYFINTKSPIESFYKLDGLKIRTAGPVLSATVKALGGIPVGLPVTRTAEALSRGVLDGALGGWVSLRDFGMVNILNYHPVAPLGLVPLASIMNKKTWDGLSRRVQAVIDKHSGEVLSRNAGGGFDKVAAQVRASIEKKKGHTITPLTEEDYRKGAAWARPLHEAWIKGTNNGRAKYEAYLKILAEIRAGS